MTREEMIQKAKSLGSAGDEFSNEVLALYDEFGRSAGRIRYLEARNKELEGHADVLEGRRLEAAVSVLGGVLANMVDGLGLRVTSVSQAELDGMIKSVEILSTAVLGRQAATNAKETIQILEKELLRGYVEAGPPYQPSEPPEFDRSPEEVAAAATRAKLGLPCVPDPNINRANTGKAAGHHEKGTGI